MNLEDRIRSSATSQVNRYQPADDLIPRIDHRRRQRVARRITASSIAAIVLFGGGALGLSALRDRGNSTNIADSPATTQGPDTVAVTTVPKEDPTTMPTVTSAPSTSAQPATNPPATNPAAPSDALVPMPFANADGSTGLSEFWNVPQYGSEAVRGSGCGSGGDLGDTIPDGLWAGFITDNGSDGIVGIDILCIYYGQSAQSVLTSGTGTLLNSEPDYLIVNNATRTRNVPIDAGIVLRLSARDSASRCVDSRSTDQWSDIPADRQVWVRIHGGRITWVLADCPPL